MRDNSQLLLPTDQLLPPAAEMRRAFESKDSSYDGVFFVAVRTTGIFCRPSCPAKPKAANTEFFGTARDCVEAGYRPCRRCRPLEATGTPPPWAARLMEAARQEPGRTWKSEDLRALGVTPERARRWFVQHLGMTFTAWCRGLRLGHAFGRLRKGEELDEVALGSGYESHSGFREAFARAFGGPPGQAKTSGANPITLQLLDSPLGPLLAGTSDAGLVFLEFGDRRSLQEFRRNQERRLDRTLVPGEHPHLQRLQQELADYFAGRLSVFSVPIDPAGTEFQLQVWQALMRIPFGQTISYADLARRIGRPTAQRAVANANRQNPVAILVPCHRVIGKDGSLTGYGGGLWRKRLLLRLEQR